MTHDTDERARAEAFGAYLKSVRTGAKMSLREVEIASSNEVSNAYLSQLENGKIAKPSPNILHSLAAVYGVPYGKLMERVGYVAPTSERGRGAKHGRAATFSVENLSAEEETELLRYLSYYRTTRRKA